MTFEHDGLTFNLLDTPGHQDFSRGHLSHAHRRRQRRHGAGRGQGHRAADPEAVRGLPAARRADHHLHQQARPRRARPVRAAGRDRAPLALDAAPGELADRHGPRLPRHLRPVRRPRCCCSSAARGERIVRAGAVKGSTIRSSTRCCRPTRSRSCARRSRWCASSARASICKSYREGHMTPVFFGSALNNFGVRELLARHRRATRRRRGRSRRCRTRSSPTTSKVTGFVFKVQANIDPQHRDRVAFLRLCSGRFRRGMKLKHGRSGRHDEHPEPGLLPGARPQPRRGGVARRHPRHPQSRHAADRRHADRGRGHPRSPASRASRPRSCAACGSTTR